VVQLGATSPNSGWSPIDFVLAPLIAAQVTGAIPFRGLIDISSVTEPGRVGAAVRVQRWQELAASGLRKKMLSLFG
jgi:hypothetical protein